MFRNFWGTKHKVKIKTKVYIIERDHNRESIIKNFRTFKKAYSFFNSIKNEANNEIELERAIYYPDSSRTVIEHITKIDNKITRDKYFKW